MCYKQDHATGVLEMYACTNQEDITDLQILLRVICGGNGIFMV